jgi:hypothetical protein
VKIAGRKFQAACVSRRLLGPPPRERLAGEDAANELQFIAGEADGVSTIGAFTIWKKGTFYVLRQGLVCLVDRPRSELSRDPLRYRLVVIRCCIGTGEGGGGGGGGFSVCPESS